MQDEELKNENLLEENEDIESDDVIFEELNAEGEVMSEKEKQKIDKNKLKEKFEEKIERLEKERDEYLSGWQRVQADYKNREREIEEYKKDIIKFANANFIKDLLPVLDGYDMARSNKEMWESVEANWRTGIEYLFSQLLKILENNGVQIFGDIGDKYNTSLHEAVETVDVEEKEKNDTIINVLQKGYKIGDKLLRAARVKVGHYK